MGWDDSRRILAVCCLYVEWFCSYACCSLLLHVATEMRHSTLRGIWMLTIIGNAPFVMGEEWLSAFRLQCMVMSRDAPIDRTPIIIGRYWLKIAWSENPKSADQKSRSLDVNNSLNFFFFKSEHASGSMSSPVYNIVLHCQDFMGSL